MKKKILIAPAGLMQMSAFDRAKRLGTVLGVDRNPIVPGRCLADVFEAVNPADGEALFEVALRHEVDAVFTMASEAATVSLAQTARLLGLPGPDPDKVRLVRDKLHLRRFLEENGLPMPAYAPIPDAPAAVQFGARHGYPFVMKPDRGHGSRGVVVVHGADEVRRIYPEVTAALDGCTAIAETFLRGQEVSVETITFQGKTTVVAIVDKVTTAGRYRCEIAHSTPSTLSDSIQQEVADYTRRVIELIGLDNTAGHTEVIVTDDGPVMVETGARLGGGYITSHLVPHSTGVDMVAAALDVACGVRPSLEATLKQGAAVQFLLHDRGRAVKISGVENAWASPGVLDVMVSCDVGMVLDRLKSSKERIGQVIATGADGFGALTNARRAESCIQIELTDVDLRYPAETKQEISEIAER